MDHSPEQVATPPGVWRVALGLCVAALAGLVVAGLVHGVSLGSPILFLLIFLSFVASDKYTVLYEVREENVASSLSGLVLSLGIFLLPPFGLIAARLLSAGVDTVRQRHKAPVKLVFNAGLTTNHVAIAALLVSYAAPALDVAQPVSWLVLFGAVTITAFIDGVALRRVMRLVAGEVPPDTAWTLSAEILEVIAQATVALAMLLLAEVSLFGPLLMIGLLALGARVHRSYVRLRQSQTRMSAMYELASTLSPSPELDSVLVETVSEARRALRAERAELVVLAAGPSGDDLALRVGTGGAVESLGDRSDEAHALVTGPDAPDSVLRPGVLAVRLVANAQQVGSLLLRRDNPAAVAFDAADVAALANVAAQLASAVARSRLTKQLQTTAEARDYLTAHDVQTGLTNRRAFIEEVGQTREPATVAILNLRGFRALNEALGSTAGDRVLVEVADRIRASTPHDAVIARLGGDEFAVLIRDDVGEEPIAAVVDAVGRPMMIRGKHADVQPYCGVASAPHDVKTVEELLRAADLAVVAARDSGRAASVRYERAMSDVAVRRATLAADLRPAIEAGQITVVHQPLVDLASERVVAVEALARWHHPTLGFVPPDEFVVVAEETGQVGALTAHVLDESCRRWAVWSAAGTDLLLSVNISAHDLDDLTIVEVVDSTLSRFGMPADHLVLEVTETTMMSDRDRASATLAALAALGVGLAIDDFGTGHSSLAYLSTLPVTEVKVDRAFIRDVLSDQPSQLIVKAVVGLAAAKAQVVVAEGIEDRATFEALRSMGVHLGQGYFMARPMHADDLPAVVARAASEGFPIGELELPAEAAPAPAEPEGVRLP